MDEHEEAAALSLASIKGMVSQNGSMFLHQPMGMESFGPSGHTSSDMMHGTSNGHEIGLDSSNSMTMRSGLSIAKTKVRKQPVSRASARVANKTASTAAAVGNFTRSKTSFPQGSSPDGSFTNEPTGEDNSMTHQQGINAASFSKKTSLRLRPITPASEIQTATLAPASSPIVADAAVALGSLGPVPEAENSNITGQKRKIAQSGYWPLPTDAHYYDDTPAKVPKAPEGHKSYAEYFLASKNLYKARLSKHVRHAQVLERDKTMVSSAGTKEFQEKSRFSFKQDGIKALGQVLAVFCEGLFYETIKAACARQDVTPSSLEGSKDKSLIPTSRDVHEALNSLGFDNLSTTGKLTKKGA